MTHVKSGQDQLVEKPEDVIDMYMGTGEDFQDLKIGAEIETIYYDPDSPDMSMMNKEQSAQFREELDKLDIENALESCSNCIETPTSAVPNTQLEQLFKQQDRFMAEKVRIASSLGVRMCPFTPNPFTTAEEGWDNIVPRERFQMMLPILKHNFGRNGLLYTFNTVPLHASISYKDTDHLWNCLRRGFYLTPFFYAISENSSPYTEANATPKTTHSSMEYCTKLGIHGGIPDYFYKCTGGEEYIKATINATFDRPMMGYFNKEGKQVNFPDLQMLTFRELQDMDLGTYSNYTLAESTVWPDIKIASIRDKDGTPVGKRMETRMFD
ncbi:MAG: hypothetical protein KAJ75_07255, partial [Alphaproteobacteria bacterium]|nr:hypothetical protein [Alphaproteobacteria bacterium]